MSRSLLSILIVVAIGLYMATPAAAVIEKFTENFTTTSLKDAANTTAVWDTAAGEIRMYEYDINLLSTYDTPGYAVKVCVAGDLAFVGDHANYVRIIDIKDVNAPVLVSSIDVGAPAFGVTTDGSYLFVACWTLGLKVFDISNPALPVQVGWVNTPGSAKDLVVSGDYVYLADGGEFMMIDVSNPASPTTPYGYLTSNAVDVAVDGRNAYVVDSSAGLLVFDLVYPQTLLTTLPLAASAQSVAVDGNVAYVGTTGGLYAIDITDPAMPVILGSYDEPSINFCQDVAVTGGVAYAAFRTAGLQMVDVRDPANMSLLDGYDTPGEAYAVVVDGTDAFVADFTAGLHVLKVGQAVNPPDVLGHSPKASFSQESAVSGHYVYAGLNTELGVFDISDPDTLVQVGTFSNGSMIWSLAVAGNYAYLSDAYAMRVVDISNPAMPVSVASAPLPSTGYDICVHGIYAFVSCLPAGLVTVNIENPTSPSVVSTYNFGGSAGPVAAAGNHVYVGDQTDTSIRVIDVTNPVTPSLVATLLLGYARDLAIQGNRLFVARDGGLSIIDISHPTSPVVIGTYPMPGNGTGARCVEVAGNYALLGTFTSGLVMVDVTQPESPGPGVVVAGVDEPYSIALAGRYAYCFNRWDYAPVRVFSPLFDPSRNVVQSTDAIVFGPPWASWVRFTPTQVDSIAWQASINSGSTWTSVTPGDWTYLNTGYTLSWRATLVPKVPGHSPSCQSLQIEWLYLVPVINAIVDVPNDEGRQVRIVWQKSGIDINLGYNPPVSSYAIYRRIDTGAAAGTQPQSPSGPADAPPGLWDYVKSVPARGDDYYSTFVPTLVDSTGSGGDYHSVFFVRAMRSTYLYYDSAPDSGWSVDNLSPHIPSGFVVAYGTEGNSLEWDASTTPDFDHFEIHRSDVPDFEVGPDTRVHATAATTWDDPEGTSLHHYRLVAVDDAGNWSEPASPQTTTDVSRGPVPLSFALYQNVPNPFNPSTTIRFDVPRGGAPVTLEIFDVGGHRIAALVDGFVEEGQRSAIWHGGDWRGRRVASGVYFARLVAPGYQKTIKLTVVQ